MCIGMANGGKTPQEKIKAIYPHIVVGGDIDKPCYTIHWYDIEQKTMICGFGSYKLELVRKWLEEEFEIVERDIDGLLNRQQKQLDNYSHNVRNMSKDFIEQQKIIQEQQAEIQTLREDTHNRKTRENKLRSKIKGFKTEIERLKAEARTEDRRCKGMRMYRVYIIDKFFKWPLVWHDVRAINKRQAKSKIFKRVLKKDKSYLLIANKLKGGADNG